MSVIIVASYALADAAIVFESFREHYYATESEWSTHSES